MNHFKNLLLRGILLYVLSFISTYSFSQELVRPTEIVTTASADVIQSPGATFSVQWLKDECMARLQKGRKEISFQILGNQVTMHVKGSKIPTVHYDIDKLMPIIDACIAKNVKSLRYTIVNMSRDDADRYAQNHPDLPNGELAVQDRPNLIIMVPSGVVQNTGGEVPASNMVGLDLGRICPPPPNCSSSDDLN